MKKDLMQKLGVFSKSHKTENMHTLQCKLYNVQCLLVHSLGTEMIQRSDFKMNLYKKLIFYKNSDQIAKQNLNLHLASVDVEIVRIEHEKKEFILCVPFFYRCVWSYVEWN